MRYVLLFILFSLNLNFTFCQETTSGYSEELRNNEHRGVFYLTGTSVLLLNTISLNAEVNLFQSEKTHLSLCGTLGLLAAPDFDGGSIDARFAGISPVVLFGPNKHFFEIKIGASYFSSDESLSYNGVLPYGALAYRFYASQNKLMVRAGIGYPEILQGSIGTRF